MRTRLAILILMLGLIATACGDDADTDVGDQPDPDTPADTDPDPDTDEPILGAGPYPIADLTVSVTLTDDADEVALTHQISCLGDTATIIGDATGRADAICRQLNDLPTRTRLLDGAPTDRACTEIYGGPELATITGTLDGEPVDTTVDRANGCGIDDWDLLSGLFPTA